MNLVSKELDKIPAFGQLEGTLKGLYSYLSRSPKRLANFREVQGVCNTQGLKLVQPIDVRWLSIENALSAVREELPALLDFMHSESLHGSDLNGAQQLYRKLLNFN